MTVTSLRQHAELTSEHRSTRWRPSRAGILNVWRYYDETFDFHRGRLLLRGPNGSGKSKALELLLPFLLDANLRANRLSTFGTGDRSMHWNLMGAGSSGVTRVGYVWLELESLEADEPTWFTCGARLQASMHSSTVQADYFTTTRRVGHGHDIDLVGEEGRALTKQQLADALGEQGAVHASAADYRNVVRRTLYPGLSGPRYEALITALLQLRTPKLSERLDPGVLSTLLSRALPPIGQGEIIELAEGFERLDRQRETLAQLDAEVEAAGNVARRAESYARRVLRAAAAELISTTSRMTTLTRTARESEQGYQTAFTEHGRTVERQQGAQRDVIAAQARIETLQASDDYRQGRALDELRQQSAQAQERARRAGEVADRLQTEATEATEVAQQSSATAASSRVEADQAREHLTGVASRVGLTGTVQEMIDTPADRLRTVGASLAAAAVSSRRGQVSVVRRALTDHSAALRDRDRTHEQREAAEQALQAATADNDDSRRAHELAVAERAERLVEWAAACRELHFPDIDELRGAADDEAELLEILRRAEAEVLAELAGEQARLSADVEQRRVTRAELAEELRRRRNRVELVPELPSGRTADRQGRPGAPLWRLIAFADGVDEDAQAGLEAALQSSGLLDAWVSPDGVVRATDGHDTYLDPTQRPAPAVSLRDVLRAEPDGPVPGTVLDGVLGAVAYGPTLPPGEHAAVAADGTWRLAALTGSWAKPSADYVGATARDRARLRRIVELESLLAALDGELATLDLVQRSLDARQRQVPAELETRPDHRPVAQALGALQRAEARLAASADTVDRARAMLASCESAVRATLKAIRLAAAETGLPGDVEALDRLQAQLETFDQAVARWLSDHQAWQHAEQLASTYIGHARQAAERVAGAEDESRRAQLSADRLHARSEQAQAAVGMSYEAVLSEIEQQRADHTAAQAISDDLQESLDMLQRTIGKLDSQRAGDACAEAEAVQGRDVAADRLQHRTAGVLAADSGLEQHAGADDTVRATLELARLLASRWPTLAYEPQHLTEAARRLAETVHQEGRSTLARRAELTFDDDDGVQLLTAEIDGMRVSAAELRRRLAADRERAQGDITAMERDLFDKTLTGDTRRHLSEKIRQAGELVDGMNERLRRVRTASRVAVRLTWEVDPALPAGTREARQLLLKDPVRLSDVDREALHTFFRQRVDEARAANTAVSWEQQLTEVFDYTTWHHFRVQIDRTGGDDWQVLTKKLHGALSGGEKAIALHLPLFAAVAAHYQSVPQAPRLILLDEVFVGVDSTNRGQVFDLLSALDLDLVLTSDHEWCTYRQLDGIAIHQLLTGDDGDDAVTTVRFVWDGATLAGTPEPAEP